MGFEYGSRRAVVIEVCSSCAKISCMVELSFLLHLLKLGFEFSSQPFFEFRFAWVILFGFGHMVVVIFFV